MARKSQRHTRSGKGRSIECGYLQVQRHFGRRSMSWWTACGADVGGNRMKDCRGVPLRSHPTEENWFRVVHLEQRGKGFSLVMLQPVVLSTNRKSCFPTPSTGLGAHTQCSELLLASMSIRPSHGTELYLHLAKYAIVSTHSEAVLQSTSLPAYRHYSKRGSIPPARKSGILRVFLFHSARAMLALLFILQSR